MVEDAGLDTETVVLMGDVLDRTWERLAPAFAGHPQDAVSLAHKVLISTVADCVKVGVFDPGILEAEAVNALRRAFPHVQL